MFGGLSFGLFLFEYSQQMLIKLLYWIQRTELDWNPFLEFYCAHIQDYICTNITESHGCHYVSIVCDIRGPASVMIAVLLLLMDGHVCESVCCDCKIPSVMLLKIIIKFYLNLKTLSGSNIDLCINLYLPHHLFLQRSL